MSSHPFGLVDDPFASGYELSLEETRLLVQNRITACGANGATLFPAETCAEIHRRSRGTASASLKLAQHALLRAAREGAPVVTPAHVQPEASESPVAARTPTQPPKAAARPEAKVAASSPPAPCPAPPAPLSREVWATHPSPAPAAPRERVSWTASMAVFLLFFGGAAVLILFLHPAGPTLRSFARASATPGAIVPEAPPRLADDSVLAILRAPSSVASAPAPVASTPAPARTAARATATAAKAVVQVRADSSRNEGPKLGLEVARFIVKDRARAERRRLATTGHEVRVLTGWEDGTQVYRVVLGSFSSQGEAERVADQLLAKGRVFQAMVVTVK